MSFPPVPLELISSQTTPTNHRRTLQWTDTVATDLGWDLEQLGPTSDAALTVARCGIGIFLADRAVRRNKLRQRREIHLIVHVPDVELAEQATVSLRALACFVTGDDWRIEFEPDPKPRPKAGTRRTEAREVALLSGGLDSYCGALIAGVDERVFLSHSDASVIKGSQTSTVSCIPGYDPEHHVSIRLSAVKSYSREPSRRSRSILFMALGVALADAVRAEALEVPENGFTSLNPPLAANRGGVLTTRSTHPYTFHLAESVVRDLELGVALRNPYEWHTKGELVKLAAETAGEDVVRRGAPHTMSCAKSNMPIKGKRGGNCGLDYACMVRRAGMLASGVPDDTPYEFENPAPGVADKVEEFRSADIAALRIAKLHGPSLPALLTTCGPFPPGYDHEAALALWRRGHHELCNLPLP